MVHRVRSIFPLAGSSNAMQTNGTHALLQRLWTLPGLDAYRSGWVLDRAGWPLADLRAYGGDWLTTYARLCQPGLGEPALWPATQQEALVSEWSRPLCFRLLMPWLAIYILFDRALPLAALQLVQDEEGRPALTLADLPCPSPLMTSAVTPRDLVEQVLAPRLDDLCQLLACRPRVVWGNAGSYWQWWVHSDHLASLIAALPPAEQESARLRLQQAQACCDDATWPSMPAGRNPLYQAMRFRGSPAKPVRRVCCQRYHLPGLEMCHYCPSLHTLPRRRSDD